MPILIGCGLVLLQSDALPDSVCRTCGYTNGVVGYIPTADEFPKGGYEVLHAYRIYGHQQMLAPGCEAAILGKNKQTNRIWDRSVAF